jgi:hypothetical protein
MPKDLIQKTSITPWFCPACGVRRWRNLIMLCSAPLNCFRISRPLNAGTVVGTAQRLLFHGRKFREHVEILERGNVAFDLTAGGDLLQQAPHDLS